MRPHRTQTATISPSRQPTVPRHRRRQATDGSWRDIFGVSKFIVRMMPRNISDNSPRVVYAQKGFLETFGWDSLPRNGAGRHLHELFGNGTTRTSSHELETAILRGRMVGMYINLFKTDGVGLSCHVYVQPITNMSAATGVARPPADPLNVCKFAVLTVRSASVVGNGHRSGVGLLGLDRISEQTRDETLSGANARTQWGCTGKSKEK